MRAGWVALGMLAIAGPAVAEVRPSDINRPVGEDGLGPGYGGNYTQWALELVGFFGRGTEAQGREVDRVNLAPVVRIATPERRNDFEVVWAIISHRQSFTDNNSTRQTLLISNVHLGYHWAWRTLAQQMRLGLSVTLPAANVPSDSAAVIREALDAYAWSAAMRGWRELWLWRPETMTVAGHADVYWRRASGFIVGGQVVAGWMQRVTDSEVLPEDDLLLQADLDFIYDLDSARIGLRVGAVALPFTDEDDVLQASVEPETRFRLGPVDLVVRLTVPLNKPAGFAFSEGGAWAAHVGIANPTHSVLPEE